MSQMLLHCGGRSVSFDELAAVPLPEETETYTPVAFKDIVMNIKQGLKEKNILKKSTYPKVMHKGLEISAPAVRCIWIDNTGFEELQPENLDLDIPRNVN